MPAVGHLNYGLQLAGQAEKARKEAKDFKGPIQ